MVLLQQVRCGVGDVRRLGWEVSVLCYSVFSLFLVRFALLASDEAHVLSTSRVLSSCTLDAASGLFEAMVPPKCLGLES